MNHLSDYNKSTSLNFKKENQTNRHVKKKLLILFLCAVFLISAVSGFVLLSENDFDPQKIVQAFKPETTLEQTESAEPPALLGRVNFLLCCAEPETKNLHYAVIACADMNTPVLKLHVLDLSTSVRADKFSGTLSEHYLYAGINQLVRAVEESTGISIERFIEADDISFQKITKIFGNFYFDVPYPSVCRLNSVSYTIDAGTQVLTPDLLYRYMIFLTDSTSSDPDTFGKLLCYLFEHILSAENINNAQVLFKDISNKIHTDISAMDFSNYFAKAETFILNDERQPTYASDTLEGF